ncbi:hypothetical protein FDUTEX481_03325 [Tolypothrix sp. PCC 7601]|nr:hypothetical protein FDUTEX481_03325 [Tolypothrix sp. PCC 7601]
MIINTAKDSFLKIENVILIQIMFATDKFSIRARHPQSFGI